MYSMIKQILLSVLLVSALATFSQEAIIKINREKIYSNIVSITDDSVYYKLLTAYDTSIKAINKKDIKEIKFIGKKKKLNYKPWLNFVGVYFSGGISDLYGDIINNSNTYRFGIGSSITFKTQLTGIQFGVRYQSTGCHFDQSSVFNTTNPYDKFKNAELWLYYLKSDFVYQQYFWKDIDFYFLVGPYISILWSARLVGDFDIGSAKEHWVKNNRDVSGYYDSHDIGMIGGFGYRTSITQSNIVNFLAEARFNYSLNNITSNEEGYIERNMLIELMIGLAFRF